MTTKKYVPKKRAPAKRDWRKMLEAIATFVNVHDEHSKNLWNVLSALRGPDNMDGVSAGKFCTTGVIRYAAGITPGPTWMVVNPDTRERAGDRKHTPSGHFQDHARKAFVALDMNWEVTNDIRN